MGELVNKLIVISKGEDLTVLELNKVLKCAWFLVLFGEARKLNIT